MLDLNNTLVEPAGMFSILHPCMHSKFFKTIGNTGSMHGELLKDYNPASVISIKTENNSTSTPVRSLCIYAHVSQVNTLRNHH